MKFINILFISLFLINSLEFINCQNNVVIKYLDKKIDFLNYLGINCNFELFSSNDVSTQIAFIKNLKMVNWIRIGINWNTIQPNETQVISYDNIEAQMLQIKASGLNTIVYFTGTPNWASSYEDGGENEFTLYYPPKNNTQFAVTLLNLAKRYSFVKYWQVWDKMNLQDYWVSSNGVQDYSLLFKECISVFKSEKLESVLSVGSFSKFGIFSNDNNNNNNNMIEELSKLDLFKGYPASYQPFTPYPESTNDQLPIDFDDENQSYLKVSTSLNQFLSVNSSSSLVFSSEFGWSSNSQLSSSEIIQANYTIKRLFLDMFNNFDKTFIYTLSDLPSSNNYDPSDSYYGLITSSSNKKQVYRELEKVYQMIGSSLLPFDQNQNIEILGAQEGLVMLFFKTSSNTTVIAFYTANKSQIVNVINLSGTKAQRLDFNSGTVSQVNITDGSVSLVVDSTMSFLEYPINDESDDSSSPNSSSSIYLSTILILILNSILILYL